VGTTRFRKEQQVAWNKTKGKGARYDPKEKLKKVDEGHEEQRTKRRKEQGASDS